MTDYTDFVTTKLRAVPPVGITRQIDLIDGLFPHQIDQYPVDKWQKVASPVWMDIDPSDTLQYRSAREHDDERHICPLQLDRLMPSLHPLSMAAGALELDQLLTQTGSMGTNDVRAALGMPV